MTDNKNALLTTVENNLGTTLAAKAAALPDGFQMAKFQQNCMVMLKGIEAEKLAKIPPQDIVECLMKGALLDLDFATGECYAIPYGKELNFQTDYKGDEKVARTYSIKPIYNVIKDIIREGDEYQKIIEDGNVKFIFKPLPLNNNKIIGAFAQVIFTDGSSIGDDANVAELETIRKQFSKAPNSPAWAKTTGEMYKKVILRRVLKNVSKSFKNSAQSIAYATATDFEFNNKTGVSTEAEKIVNVFENKLPVNNQQAITTNNKNAFAEMPQNEFSEPVAITSASQTENANKSHSDVSEYGYEEELPEVIYECSNCGSYITQAEDGYSKRNYGRPLCRDCQTLAKNGEL